MTRRDKPQKFHCPITNAQPSPSPLLTSPTLLVEAANSSTMATGLSQKRVLGESTNTRRNIPSSPASTKKRKLEQLSSPAARFKSSQNGPKGKVGSSQPSHFETEVLEKMTQDMAGLRKNNSERDQEWARPSLADFKAGTGNLIFQQIECEEGTLHDGKATVKLFGVTEVS
jgi:DNA polymerase delta subunit 1